MLYIKIDEYILTDILESIALYISDHYEILIIAGSLLFISLLSVWIIYERLGISGWKSLIPVYRHCAIFKAVGLNSWMGIFMVLPILNVPVYICFLIYLLRTFSRNYFFSIGLIILPPLFLPILAFGNGHAIHSNKRASYHEEDIIPEEVEPPVINPNAAIEENLTQLVVTSQRPLSDPIRPKSITASIKTNVQGAKPATEYKISSKQKKKIQKNIAATNRARQRNHALMEVNAKPVIRAPKKLSQFTIVNQRGTMDLSLK